jgi:hypothetical protein
MYVTLSRVNPRAPASSLFFLRVAERGAGTRIESDDTGSKRIARRHTNVVTPEQE